MIFLHKITNVFNLVRNNIHRGNTEGKYCKNGIDGVMYMR